MTKEALQEQHRMIISLSDGSSEDPTKLSIEYAISVLKELENADYQIITEDGVICIPQGTISDKIKHLKVLLK